MITVRIKNGSFVSAESGRNLSNGLLIERCAELYCSIWKEPPWNEDFWRPKEVEQTMLKELEKDEAVAIFGIAETFDVYGFTWGYKVDIEAMGIIAGHDELDKRFAPDSKVFYLDELGVRYDQRRHGVGEFISRLLLREIAEKRFTSVILRTDVRAVPARNLYGKLGFLELSILDKTYSDRSYWIKTI